MLSLSNAITVQYNPAHLPTQLCKASTSNFCILSVQLVRIPMYWNAFLRTRPSFPPSGIDLIAGAGRWLATRFDNLTRTRTY